MIKKAILKRPLFFASFIVIWIGMTGVYFNFEKKQGYANSIEVYASAIEEPNNCESLSSRNSYVTLEYEKKEYIKKVGPSYCDNLGESQIKVRFDKKSDTLFFIGETFDDDIAVSFVLLIIGIIIAFKGW